MRALIEWVWIPLLILIGIVGPGLAAPSAHADGYLSTPEALYANVNGPIAVCPTLDVYPTTSGVLGITEAISEDGFAPDDAIDIINASVLEFCPRHWPLLVDIGQAAAAGSNTYAASGRMGGTIA